MVGMFALRAILIVMMMSYFDSEKEFFMVDLHFEILALGVDGRHSLSCGLSPLVEISVIDRPSVS